MFTSTQVYLFVIQLHKESTNNALIGYKYPAILYGQMDSWLFYTVKKRVFFSIRFSFHALRQMSREIAEKKSSPIINNLFEVLVCGIAEPIQQVRQNTAQLVKIT